MIAFPAVDSRPTGRQLEVCLTVIATFVDEVDPLVRELQRSDRHLKPEDIDRWYSEQSEHTPAESAGEKSPQDRRKSEPYILL